MKIIKYKSRKRGTDMKISLLEPIGISAKAVEELAAKLVEAGHEFEYFDTKFNVLIISSFLELNGVIGL